MVPGSVRNWIAVNAVQQSNPVEKMKTQNTTPLSLKHLLGRLSLRFAFALTALALGTVALSPTAEAGPTNTSLGGQALSSNTTGVNDTALGYQTLKRNTMGGSNTATGSQALLNNTIGVNNTAVGRSALFSNTAGEVNTAIGTQALFRNTEGTGNTAVGSNALFSSIGFSNTATGFNALYSNTTAGASTATGYYALYSNTTGEPNTATGYYALYSNETGYNNTAYGVETLYSNTSGQANTAICDYALSSNTTGNYNTGVGLEALTANTEGILNTAYGVGALSTNTTGNLNIALGPGAGSNLTTGDNNIDIGNVGVVDEDGITRLGTVGTQTAAFIAGISGTAIVGDTVVVDGNGQLGTVASSKRFKDAINPMDKVSEAIFALKPVSFRYKQAIDPKGIPQFGLVAEEVAKVNPDLVVRDRKGEIYSVRYEAVNAMLLNEFLKEHATVQELKKEIAALKAGLQKVSAQVELSKPAAQTAQTNR